MLVLAARCQGVRRRRVGVRVGIGARGARSRLHVAIVVHGSRVRLGGCGRGCRLGGSSGCLSRSSFGGGGGRRSRRAFVVALLVDEDVILSAVLVAVQAIVERWVVVTLEHLETKSSVNRSILTRRKAGAYVVPFILKPVQRLLSADGAVLRVAIAVEDGVVAASPSQLRLADLLGCGLGVGDLALERVHEHLHSAGVGRVDPEPGAVADALGARGHVRRDVEDVLPASGKNERKLANASIRG